MSLAALLLTTAIAIGAPVEGEVWATPAEPVAEAVPAQVVEVAPAPDTTDCLTVTVVWDDGRPVVTGHDGQVDGSIRVGVIGPYLTIWRGAADIAVDGLLDAQDSVRLDPSMTEVTVCP